MDRPHRLATLRRLLRDTSGNFAIMTAIFTPVALALAAFAVDLGSLYLERREAQAITDLAAITAAANLDRPEQAALLTFADNGIGRVALVSAEDADDPEIETDGSPEHLIVIPGRYVADPDIASALRFVAHGEPRNAVSVTYRKHGTRYFAGNLTGPSVIGTTAIASSAADAAFSVGSRLLALEGGVANAVLGGLTGSSISLTVMDYEALASVDVSLLGFLDRLATDLDLSAATYDEVLDAQIGIGQMARSLARTGGVPAGLSAVLNRLAGQAGGSPERKIRLRQILALGDHGTALAGRIGGPLALEVGVLELIGAAAAVASGGRQVSLDLGGSVPGLLDLTLSLSIGEPPQASPWFTVGSGGEIVRTAQTRLFLDARIAGVGGILGASIRIPVYVELAFAEAKLRGVECPTGRPDSVRVSVDARPGVAALRLAEPDLARMQDFGRAVPLSLARLVQLPLVTVAAAAHVEIASTRYRTLTFTAADISSGAIRKVSTDNIASSLTGSLLSNAQITPKVAGLGLGVPPALMSALGSTLSGAAAPLDRVLMDVLGTLGLSIGEADVRVHAARCARSVLVQ